MKVTVGDKAPDFEIKDQNNNPVKLSDFKGQKVILYFYPKDNTPGCTAQACNLRDHHDALLEQGYVVLGVSTDSASKHQNFISKYDLPFTLLADTEKKVHELYGTWVEKQMYGRKYMGTNRVTFVINEEGYIENCIEKVKTKEHYVQIINQ